MPKKLIALLMALSLTGFAYGCAEDEVTPVEDTTPAPTPETDEGQSEAAGEPPA